MLRSCSGIHWDVSVEQKMTLYIVSHCINFPLLLITVRFTFSLSVSKADVASSSNKILGSRMMALAIAMRCFCPRDSWDPWAPTLVSYFWKIYKRKISFRCKQTHLIVSDAHVWGDTSEPSFAVHMAQGPRQYSDGPGRTIWWQDVGWFVWGKINPPQPRFGRRG